jgi:hypothetical protein
MIVIIINMREDPHSVEAFPAGRNQNCSKTNESIHKIHDAKIDKADFSLLRTKQVLL